MPSVIKTRTGWRLLRFQANVGARQLRATQSDHPANRATGAKAQCCVGTAVLLDTSVRGQVYAEDCEVCCHPIEVRYTVEDDAVCAFEAKALE